MYSASSRKDLTEEKVELDRQIWGSRNGIAEDSSPQRYYNVLIVKYLPAFWMNIVPSYLGQTVQEEWLVYPTKWNNIFLELKDLVTAKQSTYRPK
jgi:hypothetical protein